MCVFSLGTLSQQGKAGLVQRNHADRVKAVGDMCEKVDAKLGPLKFLQGKYDVIADVEVDCFGSAAGLRAVIKLSGAWDELLVMAEFDVDKAISAAKRAGDYLMPGQK